MDTTSAQGLAQLQQTIVSLEARRTELSAQYAKEASLAHPDAKKLGDMGAELGRLNSSIQEARNAYESLRQITNDATPRFASSLWSNRQQMQARR